MDQILIEILLQLIDLDKNSPSLVGFEPTTFGLEVRRAIHCATETHYTLFKL